MKNVLILQSLDDPAAQQAATADTLSRKLDQLRMAVQVAHTMSKQQILAGYLNDSYYGKRRVGHRGRGGDVLQHHRREAHHGPGRHAGRHRGEPDRVRPDDQPRTRARAAQHRARPDRADQPERAVRRGRGRARAAEARAAPRHRAERLHREHGRQRRLLLRLRDPHAAARQQLGATTEERAKLLATGGLQDLHHAQRAGPGRGDQRGQLRAAAERPQLQPGAQRRHRSADPAGHRQGPRDRRGPAVRHRQGPDRGRLRGQHPVRRRGGRADRIVVQAVHPDHRARAGRAVRLPADGAWLHDGQRLLQLRGQPTGTYDPASNTLGSP